MSRMQLPASLPNGKLMTAEERFLHLKKDLHQQLITSMDLARHRHDERGGVAGGGAPRGRGPLPPERQTCST